jgi:formylmethanofuran dehydrogenase subunit B
MGASKFMNYSKERLLTPMIKKNGEHQPCSLNEAIDRAAEILIKADYPVLYGWSLTSCEATGLGTALADELSGVIDNQTTVCHGPGVLGMYEVGEPTCTLGEVRHRADLIIYWGCNPEEAHPRHLERYSVKAEGRWRRERSSRKLIVVDVRRTTTAKLADQFIQILPGQDFELVTALRMALAHEEIEQEEVAGLRLEEVESLAELMRACEFGVLFYGQGVTQSRGKGLNIDALFSLVRDLNKWTKFSIMPIRGHYNVTGSNQVMTWQTGFPYAVDMSRGYPWHNPGETSIVDIMTREENDATLVVSSDPVAHFPPRAVKHMLKHPLISIDPHMSMTAMAADVLIPSAFAGIEAGGSAYRMDGVALPMRKFAEPPEGILPDEEIISMLLQAVKAKRHN